LLSVQEVCEALGMGKSWVYQRIRSGEIPSIKLGGSLKVKREDLEEYLREHWHRKTPNVKEFPGR
jgi:excisionase family DNA binding protein